MCNISENNIGIKLSAYEVAKRHYILVFLNSVYGNALTLRKISGNAQPKLNVSDITEIPIPLKNESFEKKVSDLVLISRELKHQLTAIFASTETLLLETLGLTNFTPSSEAVNIKSFRDSFTCTGRLDAEYYLPKYEQMVAHIATQPHAKLGVLVNIQKSIEPGSDAYSEDAEGLPFLRVADYSKQGLTTPQVRLSDAFLSENLDKLDALKPKHDTILFSKDGSVGEAYRLREDADFITSGAILHLTVKDKTRVLPDYLTLVLNSIVVKQQAERDAGGSIILHWRKEEIENVLVPILDMSIQQKIASQIQESFKLKAESERLLEVAKRAVEIAIEQDEQAGMNYIEQQTK
ncbi:restriction endonuclease subunit S [Polynucleobacter sp. Fuers-14]|nr:restriction endonuclease subunit S [Polynucleobacter sp. Fuers-14]